jgi:hypothetical protein
VTASRATTCTPSSRIRERARGVVRAAHYNESVVYDALTSRYSFACPLGASASVPLSSFRSLGRLPGPEHPSVYDVDFACGCGDRHHALVTQADLDWAHLGTTADLTFRNLMTARDDSVSAELVDAAATRIGAGEWPWSFYCYLEDRPRPVTPSSFALIAPGAGLFGIAVECPACSSVSVNVVSQGHLDVPFHNDASVGVVSHVFPRDALHRLEAFRDELASATFDERRLDLSV